MPFFLVNNTVLLFRLYYTIRNILNNIYLRNNKTMTLTELEQHFKARNFKPLQELYKQHNGRTFSESCTPCLVQAKKVLQNIIKAQPVVKEVIINETPKTDGHKPKQPRARKKRK